MKEIEAIKAALAAGPTPGPWIGAGPSHGKPLPEYLNSVVYDGEDGDENDWGDICNDTTHEDAVFIAACNPAAMAAVLAHIEEQAKEISILRRKQEMLDEGTFNERAYLAGLELQKENDTQAAEIERLRAALKFYAEGDHFIFDRDEWDTVSGEPQNFWCDEAGTATVEDGTIAKLMLAAMKETP